MLALAAACIGVIFYHIQTEKLRRDPVILGPAHTPLDARLSPDKPDRMGFMESDLESIDYKGLIQYSPDGAFLLLQNDEHGVVLLDARTGNPVSGDLSQDLPVAPAQNPHKCPTAFSPDGHRLYLFGSGGNVRVVETATGKTFTMLAVDPAIWGVFELSADRRKVLSPCRDNKTRVWDSESGKLLLPPLPDAIDAHFNHDGNRILLVSSDSGASLWNAETGRVIHYFAQGGSGSALRGAFSPDGKRVVIVGEHYVPNVEGAVACVWDTESGELLTTTSGHSRMIYAVAFSPDGRMIATGGDGVCVWDAATGKPITRVMVIDRFLSRIWQVAFSSDGSRVLASDTGDFVAVWNIATQTAVFTAAPGTASFSPDETKLIVTEPMGSSSTIWKCRGSETRGQGSLNRQPAYESQVQILPPNGRRSKRNGLPHPLMHQPYSAMSRSARW